MNSVYHRPFVWGVLIALAELGLYLRYLEHVSAGGSLQVVAVATLLFAGATGAAFALIAGSRRLIERGPSGAWKLLTALSHGALAGGCLLITVFSFGSRLDLLLLAPNGAFTPSFHILAAASAILALVWSAVVFKRPGWGRASRLLLLVWLGAVAASFTYTSARGSQSLFHALLVAALIGLAAWPHSSVRIGRRYMTTVAISVVLLAAGFAVDAAAGNDIRLIIHERTRMTFQLAGLSPTAAASAPQCETLEPAELEARRSEGGDALGSQPAPVRGVVFVLVDTLRADIIGRHHRGSPIAPNLTRFLELSIAYRRAYTVHPDTTSAMKGLVQQAFDSETTDEASLLDILSALPNYVVIPSHSYLLRHIGEPRIVEVDTGDDKPIHQRIDINVQPTSAKRRFRLTSDKVTEAALREFDSLPDGEPFALWVHYLDPHSPYLANELADYGSSQHALYAASVTYTDYWLGELLDGLEVKGLDDVAVVIISDHGEEFGEHGYHYHSHSVYDESTRVIMGIDLPSGPKPRSIEEPVALPALGPTLAALLGADIRRPERDLLPPWGAPADIVPLQARSKIGSVQDRWKAIFDTRTGVRELYDLAEDPGEHRNLADAQPELFETLHCRAQAAFPEILQP